MGVTLTSEYGEAVDDFADWKVCAKCGYENNKIGILVRLVKNVKKCKNHAI